MRQSAAWIILCVPLACGGPALAQTQWNTADSSRSITFGSSNTTITSGAASDRGARAVDPQTSGKYYFECQLTVQASTHTSCGVGSDWAWFPNVGAAGDYAEVAYKDGSIWRGAASRGSVGATVGTGDWIGVAVDLDNGNIWFRKNAGNWNNDASANPSTNTNGLTLNIPSTSSKNIVRTQVGLPIYPIAVVGASSDKVTANFGATSFAQSVPSGFTSGWPTNTITSPSGWYANASSTNVTFSGNSNLQVSATLTNQYSQTNYNRSAGKYYVEFSVNFQDTNYAVGIVDASIVAYQMGTSSNHGIEYIAGTGVVRRNNSTQATYSTYTTGDIVSMAVDFDNDRIWFRKNGGNWNGSSSNDPATNTGGLDISALVKPLRPAWALEAAAAGATANAATGKFGYYTFSYAVPSGFTAGWPINGPQVPLVGGTGPIVYSPLTHP